jgi:hypothetical protein
MLVHFMAIWNTYTAAIWYILGPLGNLVEKRHFFLILVYCIKINLATMLPATCWQGYTRFVYVLFVYVLFVYVRVRRHPHSIFTFAQLGMMGLPPEDGLCSRQRWPQPEIERRCFTKTIHSDRGQFLTITPRYVVFAHVCSFCPRV